jgi:hypothetical protein
MGMLGMMRSNEAAVVARDVVVQLMLQHAVARYTRSVGLQAACVSCAA